MTFIMLTHACQPCRNADVETLSQPCLAASCAVPTSSSYSSEVIQPHLSVVIKPASVQETELEEERAIKANFAAGRQQQVS
jgi:hypothetical protein